MTSDSAFYITTAIAYANGHPHMGHAYEYILADFLSRFYKLKGKNVYCVTGTDEYGKKIENAAEAAGKEPIIFCNENAQRFKDIMKALNMEYDDFIRTTERRHAQTVAHVWETMVRNDDLYKGFYSGWYSESEEAYFTEKELTIDETGTRHTPLGNIATYVEEESYFFRLSSYQERLKKFYEDNPKFLCPEKRKQEVLNFLENDLKDISVSRTLFSWGIPVPHDPKHIIYVWLDALINYLTATGYPDEKFQKIWPASAQIIGKDITRFHAVFWPSFLMSLNLPLPKCIFIHGFILYNGEKMSKSKGNVIDPVHIVKKYGADAFRYALLKGIPFGEDGSFSEDTVKNFLLTDLANTYGNLVTRVFSFIQKNEGVTLDPSPDDPELNLQIETMPDRMEDLITQGSIHIALQELMNLIGSVNKYLDNKKPWILKKENPESMEKVLAFAAECIRRLSILMLPIIPQSASKVLDSLKIPEKNRNFSCLSYHQSINIFPDHLDILFPKDVPLPLDE